MTDVTASTGMYVPMIDLTQLPSAQNVRATVTSILSLVPAPAFSSITGKPTTLAGYGISDGITAAAVAAGYQPLDADLTAIAALATTAYGRELLVQVDAAAVRTYIGVGAGSGTVTSVGLVGTANQITVSGASPITTSGSFTLSFPVGGVTLPGTTTGTFSGALTGNSSTATALQTSRTINGTSFDGTANITVTAAAGTLTGATLAAGVTASSLLSSAGGSFGTAAFTAASAYQPIDAALTALSGGSDFVQFSGPSASTKIFTLPNAAATILTDNAAVTVAQGGTGVATITGLIQGNGTSAVTGITNSSTVGQVLRVTGASTYAWGALDLADTDAVTGTLAIGMGGTGITSYTEGDLIYANAGGTLSRLAQPGVPGYILSWAGNIPVATQLSTVSVTALAGTANEITASASTGSVTLSLPSALTFTGKTVTGGTFNGGAFNGTLGATTPSTVVATSSEVTGVNGFRSLDGAAWAEASFSDRGGYIVQNDAVNSGFFSLSTSALPSQPLFVGSASRGSLATPAATQSGDGMLLLFRSYGTSWGNSARIEMFAASTHSVTNRESVINIHVTANGATSPAPVASFTSTGINSTAIGATTASTVSSTTLQATTSVIQGGGMKHQRVTTGSIGAGSTALVTLTWSSAFADSNYTVVASVIESTASSLSLSVVHIESISSSAVNVRIINNAVGSLTGELQVIAMHD